MARSLYNTVLGFREGILQGRPSNMMCYVVCRPLQSYLGAVVGLETDLIEGQVVTPDGIEWWHVWLKLPDDTVVDPTADQFSSQDQEIPKVYIGPLPDWYSEEVSDPADREMYNEMECAGNVVTL